MHKQELNSIVERYNNSIIQASEICIPHINRNVSNKCKNNNLPWWTNDLEIMKKEVLTFKQRIRCAALHRRDYVIQMYLEKKDNYETAAKNAQTESWKDFCSEQ